MMASWQPQAPPPPSQGVSSLANLGGGSASPPVARGPSEFTRVLGRAQTPPLAPPAAQLPDASTSAPAFPTPAIAQPQTPAAGQADEVMAPRDHRAQPDRDWRDHRRGLLRHETLVLVC